MNANLAALLYLVSGILFILALRGLSHPDTSRRGNLFGIIGMAIAVATTLAAHPPAGLGAWILVIVAVAIAPPAHIEISAVLPSRRSSSCSAVVISRDPVLPTGWPRAMAPPFTFTLSGSGSC